MKKTPKAPDPAQVSAAQTKSNQDTALFNANLNRVDQSSPFGSVSWSHTGDDPASGWAQQTSLSPQLQSLFDSQTQSQQGISDAISGAIGRLPNEPFNPNINVDDVRQRSFDSQMAMLNPQFEQGFKQMEGRMNDRGIPIGAEVWNDQQGEYNRAKDSSMLAASRQADLDASNEHQRQYGNAMQEYNLPLQQLSALMGNSQGVQNPSFSPFAQSSSANTDVAGNIWNKYNADVNSANSANKNLFGGLLGLGQMAMAPQASLLGYNLWGG